MTTTFVSFDKSEKKVYNNKEFRIKCRKHQVIPPVLRFESYVILNTTKTKIFTEFSYNMFESYVILNTTKTNRNRGEIKIMFESYVILNTTKTKWYSCQTTIKFESYVILNTTKTII